MIKIRSNTNEKCNRCNHHGFCQIYWGTECKRQGGKRIPRLKKGYLEKQTVPNKNIIVQNHESKQQNLQAFEPIRTRRVNWAL